MRRTALYSLLGGLVVLQGGNAFAGTVAGSAGPQVPGAILAAYVFSTTPEPLTLLTIALGVAGLVAYIRRRARIKWAADIPEEALEPQLSDRPRRPDKKV